MENNNKIKLTHYSKGAGWACKISAKELTQVLSKLNSIPLNNTESGFDKFDDCAIYKINKKQSIIQTVDFFTPIVDDPYKFGLIAAANSLSDIYAMGGKPLFALNIVAFPTDNLSLDILGDILRGGQDKCNEADIKILGGHSIKDDTPKYGLAVTSLIDNVNIKRNSNCKKDDAIILTKPIGTGILTTAIKKGIASLSTTNEVEELMATLNNNKTFFSESNLINASTDVTGYGLLGHLIEMAEASNLSAKINFGSIPIINETIHFSKKDVIPGGTKKNFDFYKSNISFSEKLENYQKLILADAQTSGGLLLSVNKNKAKYLIKKINENANYNAHIIGNFTSKKKKSVIVDE